jgi:hypothetical protein
VGSARPGDGGGDGEQEGSGSAQADRMGHVPDAPGHVRVDVVGDVVEADHEPGHCGEAVGGADPGRQHEEPAGRAGGAEQRAVPVAGAVDAHDVGPPAAGADGGLGGDAVGAVATGLDGPH